VAYDASAILDEDFRKANCLGCAGPGEGQTGTEVGPATQVFRHSPWISIVWFVMIGDFQSRGNFSSAPRFEEKSKSPRMKAIRGAPGGFRADATIWIAHNHNRDSASRIPLVHVLREKRRQNRTHFRLCSPLLDNKKQSRERNQESNSGSRAKGSLLEAILAHARPETSLESHFTASIAGLAKNRHYTLEQGLPPFVRPQLERNHVFSAPYATSKFFKKKCRLAPHPFDA
jgi:hypothetical protein